MARHNLSTVFGFEFTRTLGKPGFWAVTLAVPVVIAIVFALIHSSSASVGETAVAGAGTEISFAYTDASGLISARLAAEFGGRPTGDPAAAVEAVRAGELDAYFAFPAHLAVEPVQVTGSEPGTFGDAVYEVVAMDLLATSAQAQIDDPVVAAAAAGQVRVETTTLREAETGGGFNDLVAPLGLLGLFLLVMVLLSNQMLNSTLEEKENRVTEMILTTVHPTTLVIGKVLAVFAVGAVQIVVFFVPVVVGYLFFRRQLDMPEIDLSQLRLEPVTVVVGLLLLLGGLFFFTGVLVAIGAIMPTAKDAGVVFGPMMFTVFIPFYLGGRLINDPDALIVQVFTYFPLTAPVTAMLRNAFGTLPSLAGGIVIAELFILAVLVLHLAVRLFRYGSLAYTTRLHLRATLRRRPTAP